MTERETVVVELSHDDLTLILRYGYPFERIERAVRDVEGSESIENVVLDRLELKRLIGDLWNSIKESDEESLKMKLDELSSRLEVAERGAYTVI